jgi:hypothetical protein
MTGTRWLLAVTSAGLSAVAARDVSDAPFNAAGLSLRR